MVSGARDPELTCPVDHSFDPLAPDFLHDPFTVLASLDPETPVFYAPSLDYYVVTRHADIDAVRRMGSLLLRTAGQSSSGFPLHKGGGSTPRGATGSAGRDP